MPRHGAIRRIVLVVGGGIAHLQLLDVQLVVQEVDLLERRIEEDLAFPGRCQDLELMAEVAADGAALGAHRDGGQAHAPEGLQIGDEHVVV